MHRYRLPLFFIALGIATTAPLLTFAATTDFLGPIIPTELQDCAAGWGGLITVLSNLVKFAIGIGIMISVLMIAYAGFLWVLNPTNPENRSAGRTILMNAAIGLVLTLSAWLIVNTLLGVLGGGDISARTAILGADSSANCIKVNKGVPVTTNSGSTVAPVTTCPSGQTCDASTSTCKYTTPPASQSCGTRACTDTEMCDTTKVPGECVPLKTCIPPSTNTATGNEAAVRARFAAAGVAINHGPCAAGSNGQGCTNVGGMQENTIQLIINLNTVCNGSCGLTITGGSEPGHAGGTFTHGNGYKVDLRLGGAIDGIIGQQQYYVGTRTGDSGGPGYKDKCSDTNQYVKESDHWDVTVHVACSHPY